MQFSSTLLVIAALANVAFAELHIKAVCVDVKDKYNIYNANATRTACQEYKKRNTGVEQWKSCPDCLLIETEPPHCRSNGSHIGGKEFGEYCRGAGATKSLAN